MTQPGQLGMPPGWRGAGRPEKRVVARSKPPQKKWTGLALPTKPVWKTFSTRSDLDQRPPQQLRMLRVVRVMPLVQVERDGVGDLHRMGRDGDVDAAASEPRQEVAVEARDRARLEAHREGSRVAVGDVQAVLDEVEVDLELAVAVWDR